MKLFKKLLILSGCFLSVQLNASQYRRPYNKPFIGTLLVASPALMISDGNHGLAAAEGLAYLSVIALGTIARGKGPMPVRAALAGALALPAIAVHVAYPYLSLIQATQAQDQGRIMRSLPVAGLFSLGFVIEKAYSDDAKRMSRFPYSNSIQLTPWVGSVPGLSATMQF